MDTAKTESLYYTDPYLREFRARVTLRSERDGRPAVALDRTAFYPTGGGQPNDLGVLDGVAVIDVVADDGQIWHVLAGPLLGDEPVGRIDWDRRFDHMQQHTGQHILSEAFIETLDAETVAFHMGETASTIDLHRVGFTGESIARAEAAANIVVDAALPVRTIVVERSELDRYPLRRPPKVTEAIRVVEVAGYDWSACGGTHVADSAQVGSIKVTGIERRGAETRVSFLCGGRARRDHARLQRLIESLSERFTTAQDELPDAVDRLLADGQTTRRELGELEAQWVTATAAALTANAQSAGSHRVVDYVAEITVDRAKRLAQALRNQAGVVAIVGVPGERPQMIVTRADDVAVNAGDLLKIAVAAAGGRGGGRPDWAQGGVPANDGLPVAIAAAMDWLTSSSG